MGLKYYMGTCCGLLLILNFSSTVKAQGYYQDSLIKRTQMQSIGYDTQPAWKVTSAISTVKGDKLQKSFTSNLATTLYARLPGLTVSQQNTEPGLESPTLLGRGTGTFGTGRKPLIMVDGFESNFEQLVPAEIETISLLKDAAATAIYGSRGANGVLLVTSKRGKKQPLSVNFSAQGGFNEAASLPEFLNAYDYAKLNNEARVNDGKAPVYTADDLAAYQSGSDPYFHPNVNWYNEALRKRSPIANYNLNFSGGDNSVRYFGLLNIISNNSLLRKSGDMLENSSASNYKRYNFRTNVDVNLTKSLTGSLTLAGSVEDKTNPVGNNTLSLFQSLATIAPNAFPVRNPNGSYGGSSLRSNPLGDMLENGSYSSNGRTLQTTLRLTENLDVITKGLSLSGGISFNNFFKNYSIKSRQHERFSIVKNTAGDTVYTKYGQQTSLVGDESQSDQWRNFAIQGSINYNHTFDVHQVDAMVIVNSDSYTIKGEEHPFKHIALGGRFTYSNNEKYIGEFSFSYMGSENFPKANQFGFFPAVSLGWVTSAENFLKGNSTINYLKLKGSYGLVGNDNIGGDRFMFDQIYRYPAAYFFGTANTSSSSLEEGRLANPNITWEKDKKLNIGLEATLFNRLDLSFDVFRNNRYDILVTPRGTLPGFFGMDLPFLNQGKVENKGFELMLRYNNKPAPGEFEYFIEASAWYAKNKIVNLSEEIQQYGYQSRTGKAIDQPFGLEAVGFFKDAADITASPRQVFTTVVPGDIKYKDQNGDGVIDVSDNVAIGNTTQPELTIGVNPGFRYKGFDLEMLFQGVIGRSSYLSGLGYFAFQNNGKISAIAEGRWTPETAQSATYPRLSAQDNANNFVYSSFWQNKGDFIKLRSLELGYTCTHEYLKKVKINSARVFANGTNLFSWDKLEYGDPETAQGYVGYPSIRTVSFGVKLGF